MEKMLLVFKLLPAIISAMKAIEEAIPGKGAGEAKLTAVRQLLELVDGGVATVWPEIAKTIGILVNVFNTVGWNKPAA